MMYSIDRGSFGEGMQEELEDVLYVFFLSRYTYI